MGSEDTAMITVFPSLRKRMRRDLVYRYGTTYGTGTVDRNVCAPASVNQAATASKREIIMKSMLVVRKSGERVFVIYDLVRCPGKYKPIIRASILLDAERSW